MSKIAGRTAVVTGGASGIGLGIARQLIAEGAQVVLADIQEGALKAVAMEIGAFPVVVDVSREDSVAALADSTLAEFGAAHIVVNNAGVGPMARIADLSLADWRWMIDVNLYGVIHGVHTFLPILQGNESGGHIVNTASMASFSPLPGLGAYAVTKFGVAALTEVLRAELKDEGSKVSATLLAPGTVHTNIKESLRNRPGSDSGALFDTDIAKGEAAKLRWLEPLEVGKIVTRAIRNDDAYALTHPEWWPMVEERNEQIKAAFGKYAE
ncbi:SDR family NAD(P)-dependent oxidoreductase [Arthrobacter sp. KN11-1C]|uniref:SDR family NAD(P)-dependent oxidoreductase n=1 Tax=Arthrobacter sp. KN11-1C TaxID=3445774 RepID=UPI003F9F3637